MTSTNIPIGASAFDQVMQEPADTFSNIFHKYRDHMNMNALHMPHQWLVSLKL